MSAPRIRTPGQLKVPELKEELRKRGITPKGLKKDLVEKLEEVLRNEGQEHVDNSSNCYVPQPAPAGHTSPQQGSSVHDSPLPLADSGTQGYDSSQFVSVGYTSSLPISSNNDSPPPDVDSRTLDYTPLPYLSDLSPHDADTENMHVNSPLQVADLRIHGDFGRKNAEGYASEWKSSAANVSMVISSASEPARMEDAIQKGEHTQQFDFTTKSPSGLAHDFPSADHDKKGDAFCADGSVITGAVDKNNESSVYGSEPKVHRVAICHEKQLRDNKAEVSLANALLTDESDIATHFSPNVVVKHSNMESPVNEVLTESEDVHVQCTTLDPLSDGFESEPKTSSEKTEVVHFIEDNADYSHLQRMEEQKSEEQEDKGNSLTAQRDDIFKLNKISPVSAEKTNCKVITVAEEPIEHEAVHKNCEVITASEEPIQHEAAETNCKVTTVPEEPMEHEVVQNQSINTHLNALELNHEPGDSSQESGAAHLGSGDWSVSEVPTESENVHVQCKALGPLSDGYESEAKINSEKAEAVHITDNADYSQLQRMREHKFEEQGDKGDASTAERDNIVKHNKIGPDSAEKANCKVITVLEEPIEHEAVQTNCKVTTAPEEPMELEAAETNCKVTTVPEEPMAHEGVQNQSINTHLNALELNYEPVDSSQESRAAHLGFGECSVSEVLTEFESVHVQCRALGPLSDGYESETKINWEKAEAIHITDNADCSQLQRTKEHTFEEQGDEGNALTAERDNIAKQSKIGPYSAEKENCKVITVLEESIEHEAVQTNCKIITVPEEPMEHEAVQADFKATTVPEEHIEQEAVQNQSINTNVNALELKYEPRDSCWESGAAHLEQKMVEYSPSMREDQRECVNDENNRDKMPKMSETDPKFDYKQMFNTNSVREHTEHDYIQNQYTSLSNPASVFESEPKVNLEELEADQLKLSTEISFHDMHSSGQDSEEAEIKEHAPVSQSGRTFKLNMTDLNLADEQTVNEPFSVPENVEGQFISSHSISKEVKSEHRANSDKLETAQCKQNVASHDYSMGERELKCEEQEEKGNALQIQHDGVSTSFVSNTLLEEKRQSTRMLDNEEKVKPVDGQSHESSFNLTPNRFELMPRSNFKELEAEGLQQKGEEHHQPIGTGDQEPEEQVKEGTPSASHKEEVLRSCETDPSLAEKGNHTIISLPEVSMELQDLQSKNITHSSVSYELKCEPGANLEDTEDKHEHPTRMGKQGNKGQKNSANESIVEGGSCSCEYLTDEWKEKSQLPMSQSKLDLAREGLVRPNTVKLSNKKTEERVPMDVDSEVQMGRKQKDQDCEARQEPAKRQRRWNSGKNLLLEASNTKPLTTDTLKEIIPEKAVEIPLGSSSGDSPVSPLATKASQFLSKAAKTSFSRPAPSLKSDSVANGEKEKPRIVPPPARSPTISLKIERFLRPFTIKALKELLSERGTIRYFWIDQIKTHCYVTYSSVEEATATRNALYNLKWPIVGGRLLIAEFADPEEVMLVCEGQSANIINPMPQKNSTQGSSSLALQGSSAQALPPPPQPAPKTKQPLAPEREPEPAVYTLDDLFKKSRAKPHIYYLPLTEEQVASKLAARGQDQQIQKVRHL